MTPATVVNMRKSGYDVYIGRPSLWGNPFTIGRDGDRARVIARYEEYLLTTPALLNALPTLRGKRLGCFCAPLPCHGGILVKHIPGPTADHCTQQLHDSTPIADDE